MGVRVHIYEQQAESIASPLIIGVLKFCENCMLTFHQGVKEWGSEYSGMVSRESRKPNGPGESIIRAFMFCATFMSSVHQSVQAC